MIAKRVAKNAIYNSSAVLVGNVSGLIITIFLARTLGPKNFGIYSLSISIAFLVLAFADLGIDHTITRYISDAMGKNNLLLIRGYTRELGKMKIFLTGSTSLILFTLSNFLAEQIFHNEALSIPLKVVSVYIFLYSISNFFIGISNGLNDFKANFVRSVTYEFSRVVSIIVLVTLGYSVIGAILGYVIATFVSTATLIVFLLRQYRQYILGLAEKIDKKKVIRFTGYLTIGSIAWTVFAYVDSVMIGMFMSAEYVGYYRAGYSIIGAMAGILSVPAVLFPVFVQLEGKDLKNAFNRVFKYSSIFAVPASFGLPAISKEVILAVYGSDYLAALPVFWILSFLILRSAIDFWAVIFNAKEKPEYPVKTVLIGMVMNVILNYLMIPPLGIVGAALATLASNIAVWIILAYFSKKEFGIFFEPSHLTKPVIASLVMLAFLFMIAPRSIIEGIEVISLGIVFYFAALYVIGGIDREDIVYFLSVLGR